MKNDPAAEAIKLVDGDRQSDYGHPLDNWGGTAKIWSVILSKKLKADITAEEAALCMVGVKLSREAFKPNFDNRVDGCGYFRVEQMCIEERERRLTSGAEMTKTLLGKMAESVDDIERKGGPDKVREEIKEKYIQVKQESFNMNAPFDAVEKEQKRIQQSFLNEPIVAPSAKREFAKQLDTEEAERQNEEIVNSGDGPLLGGRPPVKIFDGVIPSIDRIKKRVEVDEDNATLSDWKRNKDNTDAKS